MHMNTLHFGHATSRRRWHVGGLTLFLIGVLSAAEVSAQCGVPCADPMKACVCVIEPVDAPVNLVPFGSVMRQPARVGLSLSSGDQLSSVRADAIAEVACPGGSEVKLHGQFLAIVRPSGPGQDCVFDLLAGNADVLGAKPTQVEAGDTLMGSSTTLYSIRVRRTGEALDVECLVFEGEAQVRYANRWSRGIKEGSKTAWRLGSGDPTQLQVTDPDVRATSSVYARADLARLRIRGERPSDPRALLNELNASYARVMTRPRDAQARLQLAALQTDLGNSKQVLYHVQRAEQAGPVREDDKTAIAVMKYTALKQTGRDAEANVEIEKVRVLDPAQYERIRKLDPAKIRLSDPALQRIRKTP
jgi:hypothetical protein